LTFGRRRKISAVKQFPTDFEAQLGARTRNECQDLKKKRKREKKKRLLRQEASIRFSCSTKRSASWNAKANFTFRVKCARCALLPGIDLSRVGIKRDRHVYEASQIIVAGVACRHETANVYATRAWIFIHKSPANLRAMTHELAPRLWDTNLSSMGDENKRKKF